MKEFETLVFKVKERYTFSRLGTRVGSRPIRIRIPPRARRGPALGEPGCRDFWSSVSQALSATGGALVLRVAVMTSYRTVFSAAAT